MKYVKKDAHMLGPEEPTHEDKLQRVPRKLNARTCHTGRIVNEIFSEETTRRYTSDACIMGDTNLNRKPCKQKMSRNS
ncbi:unnamed protein product [Prunus armeniaca]